MKARAPGKLVLSGAYAVLRGAPAVVTAVNRYAEADTAKPATFVTPEVREALAAYPQAAPPYFDASALRDERGKLGLGSSAAIVVATLAALEAERSGAREALGPRVLDVALEAHRKAQGGGSGIDVLAAALGGTLLVRRHAEANASASGRALAHESVSLPKGLVLEVWVMGQPASTSELVKQVFALEARDSARFGELLGAQSNAAERAARAVRESDASGFIAALAAQHEALLALGEASGAPIVTVAVRSLHERAMPRACVLPSGAGGGDVSLYAGLGPSDPEFRRRADELGLFLLDVELGAPGAHSV